MAQTSSARARPTYRMRVPTASLRHLFADLLVLSASIIFTITGAKAVFAVLLLAWVYKLGISLANFRSAVGLVFVNAGIVLWYIYPSAITMTEPGFQIGPEFAFVHFMLAVLAMLTTLADMAWTNILPKNFFVVPTSFQQFRLVAVLFMVLGTSWVVSHAPSLGSFVDALLTGRGAADKAWRRGDTNFSSNLNDSVALLFSTFLIAATIMFSFLIFQPGKPERRLAILTVYLALVIFAVIDSGTRFVLAIATLPAFINWMYSSRLSPSRIVAFLVLSVGLVVGSQFLMHGRHYGYENVDTGEITRNIATLGGTIDYFGETESAMRWFEPAEYPESNLFIFATILIPRSLFPSKPYSKVAEQFTFRAWGLSILTSGGNKFPGVVGQYYISSGWLLFLNIPLFWGFFSAAVSRGLQGRNEPRSRLEMALPIAYGVWLLFSFRFVSPGQLLPIFFIHMALFAVKQMHRLWR